MDLAITTTADETHLRDELRREFSGVSLATRAPGVLALEGLPNVFPAPFSLIFSRQFLPDVSPLSATSIRAWADLLFQATESVLASNPPWRLHVWPRFGESAAGHHRCELIVEALHDLLRRHQRQRRRQLDASTAGFTPQNALIQLMLTGPDQGFLSLAVPPTPYLRRHHISPFPSGEVPVAVDKTAPSRAFAKLVEAEKRLGRSIQVGESCVDLGACPGSWSYVAIHRGAHVTSVDRSPLRDDLMRHSRLTFHCGDAFAYRPQEPVDWLICDVIAAPERTLGLLKEWIRHRWCRHFIVSVKFKGTADYAILDPLKAFLPTVCSEFQLTRLCANRNEACVAGTLEA